MLSNVLHATLSIRLKLQNKYNSRAAIILPLMCGEFDVKLEILYAQMVHKAICVLQSCFNVRDMFDAFMVHNMLALVLDPIFKTLKCVKKLIRRDKV